METNESHIDGKIVVRVNPMIVDLIPQYLVEQQKKARSILESLEQEDYELIRRLGHDIKGTGSAYGFPTISKIGKAVEDAAKSADATTVHEQIQRLEQYIDRVEVRSR